jgi:UDP-N-acetylmuramoyl-tripeptide--D-alanyl-D-alanine ligase
MMSLAEAAAAMQGRRAGTDVRFSGVSTDSRGIGRDELFVAIRGERFDGHEFLGMAKSRGASAALVDERFNASPPLPVVVVDDTRKGLGRLARHWRSRFAPAVVGIAGANGKTTTKEMLAAILRAHAGDAAVLATKGNLNTDIGVPLTVLQMSAAHRYGVIELGMNHPGEIEWLAAIAQPTIGLVTNAQREHMEFMGSVAASAQENSHVFRVLPTAGVAVVNADDACRAIFLEAAGRRRIVEFGLDRPATVTGGYALKPLASDIVVRTPEGETRAMLAIPGLHNVRNAIAAAACAHAVGIPVENIGKGLAAFRPYAGRLQVKRARGGAILLDDSYNANPDSVRAAIDVLAACPAPTVLVLGDMGEVGAQGPQFHREAGAYARERGIGALYALGSASRDAADAFGQGGRHFDSPEHLRAALPPAATVLVKGSRFMRMERVVAALTGEGEGSH